MRRPSAAAISPATAVIGLFLTFGLTVASFFPFLSVYFAGRGFDPSEIGLLLSAMALVRFVAMPVWGHVADTRIGRKRALQLGLVGMVVFAIVASVLDTLVGVAFGAVGIAIAMAASGRTSTPSRSFSSARTDVRVRPDPRVGEPLVRGRMPRVRMAVGHPRRDARPPALRGDGCADARMDDDRRPLGSPEGARASRATRRRGRGVPDRAALLGLPRGDAPRMDGVQRGMELRRSEDRGTAPDRRRDRTRRSHGGGGDAPVVPTPPRIGLRKVYALGCLVYATASSCGV